ncbi:MAG TPA: serine/threonine-protein kinase [Ktedonobacteraceae bacterium]|nr:serine/threonine-protein kinase [Ktedonobacteraceae bacterium]
MSFEGAQLDHYRLLRLIGRGAMSEVYLAEDTRISRQVAIKVIPTNIVSYSSAESDQESAQLFRREMQAITRLDHPHILTLYDFGEQRLSDITLAYLVMPFRPDGSLSEWLRSSGNSSLSPTEVARLLDQAADALQYAHDHDIIHQDIKPSNFLIRPRSNRAPDLLLTDFGIAQSENATTSEHTHGSPAYIAPEQWHGHPVPASDQYSLAIVAYQLLTGHLPFSGPVEQIMELHMTAQPQPPSSLNPQVSPALDAVILRALAKKPEERFASISEFSNAFQQALQATGELYVTQAAPSKAFATPAPLSTTNELHISPPPPKVENKISQALPKVESKNPVSQTLPKVENKTQVSQASKSSQSLPKADSKSKTSQMRPKTDNKSKISQAQQNARRQTIILAALGLIILIVLIPVATFGSITYQNSINAANATATASILRAAAAAASNPYPPHRGTLIFDDPLSQPSTWRAYPTPINNGGRCLFTSGAYHVLVTQTKSAYYCNDVNTIFSNFAFEVQMTIHAGDCGGIVFRVNPRGQLYFFRVCQDQSYMLILYMNHSATSAKTLIHNQNSAIHAGLHQTNTLAVVAINNTLNLYANHTLLSSISDTTYSTGEIGLLAETFTHRTEVIYTHARIWTL